MLRGGGFTHLSSNITSFTYMHSSVSNLPRIPGRISSNTTSCYRSNGSGFLKCFNHPYAYTTGKYCYYFILRYFMYIPTLGEKENDEEERLFIYVHIFGCVCIYKSQEVLQN